MSMMKLNFPALDVPRNSLRTFDTLEAQCPPDGTPILAWLQPSAMEMLGRSGCRIEMVLIARYGEWFYRFDWIAKYGETGWVTETRTERISVAMLKDRLIGWSVAGGTAIWNGATWCKDRIHPKSVSIHTLPSMTMDEFEALQNAGRQVDGTVLIREVNTVYGDDLVSSTFIDLSNPNKFYSMQTDTTPEAWSVGDVEVFEWRFTD